MIAIPIAELSYAYDGLDRLTRVVDERGMPIAFGWDRIVALLVDAPSIRDVIAFPKIGAGWDPLTDAPAEITPQQREEAGVDYVPEEESEEETEE